MNPPTPVVCWLSDGYVCQEYGFWREPDWWDCDCETHAFFCVGCGTVQHSDDGKVYFYFAEHAAPQWVCDDCVRGPNPHYIWWRQVWNPAEPKPDKATLAARALLVSKLGAYVIDEERRPQRNDRP